MLKVTSIRADQIGIISAGICLVHCVLTPLLFGVYAQAGPGGFGASMFPESMHTHSHGDWFGIPIDYIFLSIGFIAVLLSSRHAHSKWIKGMMWVSYGCLLVSILNEQAGGIFLWTLYLSSVALIASHIINIRKCVKCATHTHCQPG